MDPLTTTPEESLDPFLLSVLQNSKNRHTLKKLEETLNQFVLNGELQRLEFPPKGSFQRRIIHRVASRYGLDNILLAAESNGSKSDKRRLVLLKTEQTKIPSVLLSEYEVKKEVVEQSTTAGACNSNKPLFLKRNMQNQQQNGTHRNFHRSSSFGGIEAGTGNVIRGVTEEEYQKARARIFNSNQVSKYSQVDSKRTVCQQDSWVQSCSANNSCELQVPDSTRPPTQESLGAVVDDKETENDVFDPDFDRSCSRWGATIPLSSCASHTNQTESYSSRPPVVGNYINSQHSSSKYQNAICTSLKGSSYPSSMMPRNITNEQSLASSYPALQFPNYHLHCSFGDSSQKVTYLPNGSIPTASNEPSIYLSKEPASSYIHEFPPLGRT